MAYRRADFSVLRDTVYGIGFHWTTWTAPRTGPVGPFQEAVEAFDVGRFVDQVASTGAGHVLLTSTHYHHHFPGPNPEVDRIMPGLTCQRDLIMEIADGLAAAGIKLMLYYHHGTDGDQPMDWRTACGAEEKDQTRFYENYFRIVRWMGEHYGPKVIGYWFDAGYALMRRGTPPWEKMLAVAKAGNPDRLICYNSGIENHEKYTDLQDYWAGEIIRLNFVPRTSLTPSGLPWYSYTSWHAHATWPMCGEWGFHEDTRDLDWPAPPVEAVEQYLRRFMNFGGAVTFNVLAWRDGAIHDQDLAVLQELKKRIRK